MSGESHGAEAGFEEAWEGGGRESGWEDPPKTMGRDVEHSSASIPALPSCGCVTLGMI